MATRKELIAVLGARYRASSRSERGPILDELVRLAGYHRKHAVRVLNRDSGPRRDRRARDRLYDEMVRQALIVLWEAGDRICGKRLKALLPILIESMERHAHLKIEAALKAKLLCISAASIDRILSATRQSASGGHKRRSGISSAIRRAVPIRTFADWKDPAPGYFEVDFVEHCGGPKYDGNFVHSLVLTDIATGWTECHALPVRDTLLVVEGFAKVEVDLPFALRGIDTDNDSAFMTETVFQYCQDKSVEFTRSRPYKKNDQAWVEQKNGSVVRRLVGYGRLSGLTATGLLADLYRVSRLYINFFQPCFKLKSKTRDGAFVKKTYHAPLTPYERVLGSPGIDEVIKQRLRTQFADLDPVKLLQTIREAQRAIAEFAASGAVPASAPPRADLPTFLTSLSTAWGDGEVRPTHRKKPSAAHWWRSRVDPFELTWPTVEKWLEAEPGVPAKDLMKRLAKMIPEVYSSCAQLRTLQRRVKIWRAARAKQLVLGSLDRTRTQEDVDPVASP